MPGNPTSHHGGGGMSRREHQHREIETQEGLQNNVQTFLHVTLGNWLLFHKHQYENFYKSARDETHTMHAIPMIPNEEHDYGSRNFNQRDSNSINPVNWSFSLYFRLISGSFWQNIQRSGRPASRATSEMWSGVWSGLNLPTWGGQTGGQKSTTTSQVNQEYHIRDSLIGKCSNNEISNIPEWSFET